MHVYQEMVGGAVLNFHDVEYVNEPIGYSILYLFSTILLLLLLSQFFIAILVSSWDAARDFKHNVDEVEQMPPGFSWRHDARPRWRRAIVSLRFFVTGYTWSGNASGMRIKRSGRSLQRRVHRRVHCHRHSHQVGARACLGHRQD